MKKAILAISILLIGLLLFGCTQVPVCGNNICEGNETSNNCPQDCGVNLIEEKAARAAWEAAEPIGIVDWFKNGDELGLLIKNNSSEPIEISGIELYSNSPNSNPVYNLLPGNLSVLAIKNLEACDPSKKFRYSKEDITIDYDTQNIDNKIQKGIADIVGNCIEATTCLSSDEDNIYTRGHLYSNVFGVLLTTNDGKEKSLGNIDEFCASQKKLVEFSCNGPSHSDPDHEGRTAYNDIYISYVECPNGCLGGTCVKEKDYFEGDTIFVEGNGIYFEKKLSLKITAINLAPPGVNEAEYKLYDEEDNLIESKTGYGGQYLHTSFSDGNGDYAIAQSIEIITKTIDKDNETGQGYVTIKTN